jgi:molecular chaperone GrpE (heat shock protein)
MTQFTTGAREMAIQKNQLRKQQEKILSDLLPVLDALDHAAAHWQQAEQAQSERMAAAQTTSTTRWRWWFSKLERMLEGMLKGNRDLKGGDSTTDAERLAAVITSAHEGIEMIRDSMLTVLSAQQVAPMPALGNPFDPNQMYALGQQVSAKVAPNTVLQEVVRGYRWQDRTLREAQVIVAIAKPPEAIARPENAENLENLENRV